MAKDINIHLKAHGAERTKQQLEEVGKSAQKTGDSANQGGKTGAEGVNKLSDAAAKGPGRFARFSSSIKSWVFGLVGISAVIAGITRAIQVQKQAMEEHGRIAAEQQKKMLALMGMGTFFEEHPQARKRIAQMAEFGRRPFEQVAEAWYNLESKGAGLTEKQKEGIMTESLELGRMEPEADLKSIVDVFSLYAKETRQQDINQIQNVLRQTLSQAGAELSQIGQYLPQFLSLGLAGGLTGAETAGLWAFATTRAPSPEKATVGIRNIFAALRGKGTPESAKLLEQLGITTEMSIFDQLSKLASAQKAGKFGVPEAEVIAGKENIAVLLSMLTEPTAMRETVSAVTDVARPDIDIVRDKLEKIMGEDEIARLEEEIRRLEVVIQNQKATDVRALRWSMAIKEYERRMRKEGRGEVFITLQKYKYLTAAAMGAELEPHWFIEPSFSGYTKFPQIDKRGKIIPEPVESPPPLFEPGEVQPIPAEEPPAIPPVSKETEIPAGQTVNNINYNWDHSIKYYPRVGSDESGPRIPGGVMV